MRSVLGSALVAALLLFSPSTAKAIPIDFESLSDLEPVTNQFSNATFSNATVLTAGISLDEFEFPPKSGSNAVFDDGGPISIVFTSPIGGFGGYFTYSLPLTINAFDTGLNLLGSITSAFNSNLGLTGEAGSSPNEFLEIIAAGISSITITGDAVGASLVMDDVTFRPLDVRDPAAVPEPGTWVLMLSGAALLIRKRRQTKRDSIQ